MAAKDHCTSQHKFDHGTEYVGKTSAKPIDSQNGPVELPLPGGPKNPLFDNDFGNDGTREFSSKEKVGHDIDKWPGAW